MENRNPVENSNAQQQPEEPQAPGMGRYMLYFLFGFIIMRMFAAPGQNHPKVKNLVEEGDKFDIFFYISNKTYLEQDDLKKLNPVFQIENIPYSNMSVIPVEIITSTEITVKYTHHDLKRIKDATLYLFSFVKVKNSKKEAYMRKLFSPSVYIDKVKILKYVEKLSTLIRNIDNLNDMQAISENTTLANYSDENYIQDLYYIPEIYLYMINYASEEDPTTFEELRMMGVYMNVDYKASRFLPKCYLTDFWTMMKDLKSIKKGENEFKIKINFKYLSNFFFRFLRGVEFNSDTMEKNFAIQGVKDNLIEIIKYNSVPYLVLIFSVNLLHTIFSFLGFANDISYYKNLKNLDGLYTKFLYYNLFHYLIAFIYFYIENASYIVMIELFVATAIELWKFRKIFKVEFSLQNKYIIKISYLIKFKRDISKDYEDEAISMAMKFIFIPISVLYLSYRIYHYHAGKTLFKFIIEYIFFLLNMFGFILLTPQVYLNYKLQSVEHLPIKVLSYKFLNTIIDDLFAFAVDTPTLYRISVFKDDVIFVIYIYQMIKYRNNRTDPEPEEVKRIEENKSEFKESEMTTNNISEEVGDKKIN